MLEVSFCAYTGRGKGLEGRERRYRWKDEGNCSNAVAGIGNVVDDKDLDRSRRIVSLSAEV